MLLKDKKIVVTGGAGFIGSNLTERFLGQGNRVVVLDNFATGKRENVLPFMDHPRFRLIEGDIRNLEDCKRAVEQADVVFHQAALGSVPRSIKDPITTNEVNISGFLNMLVASRDHGVERFVYAASSSTYGDSPELPKVEERIGSPLSPYAVTKLANELYARVFASLYGMKVIGLRYFNVFGKRQDPQGAYAAAIPKFIKSLIAHESPLVYGDGTQTRDFTYIENVIQANELAGVTQNPEAFGQVFNVAFGRETVLNDLLVQLRLLLKEYDPAIGDIQVRYEAPRVGDIAYSLASIDKAKRLLEYQPEYDLNKGLVEAIDWYWNNLSGKND